MAGGSAPTVDDWQDVGDWEDVQSKPISDTSTMDNKAASPSLMDRVKEWWNNPVAGFSTKSPKEIATDTGNAVVRGAIPVAEGVAISEGLENPIPAAKALGRGLLGSAVGAEGGGWLGQQIGGDTGRQVGRVAGGIAGGLGMQVPNKLSMVKSLLGLGEKAPEFTPISESPYWNRMKSYYSAPEAGQTVVAPEPNPGNAGDIRNIPREELGIHAQRGIAGAAEEQARIRGGGLVYTPRIGGYRKPREVIRFPQEGQ